jgi:streptomycin 6-kinase
LAPLNQTAPQLDPWRDGPLIAQHLANPSTRLFIVLGAEAWCQKCRQVRPAFNTWAKQAESRGELCLWLDLEDHAELLGGYIPDDLPLLLEYAAGQLLRSVVVREALASTLTAPPRIDCQAVPDLHAVLRNLSLV